MPHSSGGGSHGGGSHGGHSRSSGSSRLHRTSTKPFSGSRRYLYYKKKKPVFVYADYDISSKTHFASKILSTLFMISFGLMFVIVALSSLVHDPKKMELDYDTSIHISDQANVIDDEEALGESLNAFLEETGITPSVITLYNEDWMSDYKDLESYAYDEYIRRYDDEKHWLIVFSQPKDPDPSFNDWYWEGMQGNDTDPILDSKTTAVFNSQLQKNLLLNEKMTTGEAIKNAFDTFTPVVMEKHINFEVPVALVIALVLISITSTVVFGINPKNDISYLKAMPCDEQYVDQEACEYCDGIYVVGLHDKCPHCNAPIKPGNITVNEKGK